MVFPGLGDTRLWQDEAQTAVISSNILESGLPKASDGVNTVTLFSDHRDIKNGIYIWQPWLPNYIAAGSMWVFGKNSFGARFAFAAAFVILIIVSYGFFKRWSGSDFRALLTTTLMVFNVTLLLHARQCRYYILVPLFSILAIHYYLKIIKDPKFSSSVFLIFWFCALYHSFFPAAFLLAIALGVHLLIVKPSAKTIYVFVACALVFVLINAPYTYYAQIWSRQFGVQPGYSSLHVFFLYFLRYTLTLNNFIFPFLVIISALFFSAANRYRKRGRDDLFALSVIICFTQLIGFSLLSDYPFSRYLIGIIPFFLYLGAVSIEYISFNRRIIAWSLTALIVATNLLNVLPLRLFAAENPASPMWSTKGVDAQYLNVGNIGADYAKGEIETLMRTPVDSPFVRYLGSVRVPARGPMDAIIDYLLANANSNDRVKIAYGDLPLMFHTHFKIVSSAEIGDPAPDWIIPRKYNPLMQDKHFVDETYKYPYRMILLNTVDTQWNNRPDPVYHNFSMLMPFGSSDRLRLLQKIETSKGK